MRRTSHLPHYTDMTPKPDDGFYLTPSCILGALNPSAEPLIAETYDLVGVRGRGEQVPPQSQGTCCSGILFHGDVMTLESTLLTVARLWNVAAEEGFDSLSTACVTSFGVHHECLEIIEEDADLADRIDQTMKKIMKRRLVLPRRIFHASDVYFMYRDVLASMMKYRLVDKAGGRPLRVVDHVGCHYNKLFPQKSIGGTEYCDVLAAPIRSWGGAEVDYPERRHCCGMGFRQCMIRPNRGYTMACVLKKLRSMAPYKPDLMLTNCPGCNQFLDREQWAVQEMTGEVYNIPVLSYAELAGLLLGFDPYEQVGIQSHTVAVEPLLEKIGIPYGKEFRLSRPPETVRKALTAGMEGAA